MQASVYPADVFIGTVLNVSGLHINGYPLSFIVWNIFLATMAVLVGRWLVTIWKSKKAWYIKSAASLLWLALLPNTAYLMTDARHIIGYCPLGSYGNVCAHNAWMTLMFFAYAAIGWPAFTLALRPAKQYIARVYGNMQARFFIAGMCLLSALGVLLGLVNRFNSWELLTKPIIIIKSALRYITEIDAFANLLIVSVILVFLYSVGEKIFVQANSEK